MNINKIIEILKKSENKQVVKIISITLLVLSVILFERILSLSTTMFKSLENTTYDVRAKIATDNGPFSRKGFKHADKDIVLVLIDDYSRKEIAKYPFLNLGSFPWNRNVWADVVNYIEQGNPKAILFDIIFNELNPNPYNDKAFAKELLKYDNIVLATTLNEPKYLVDKYKNYFMSTKEIIFADLFSYLYDETNYAEKLLKYNSIVSKISLNEPNYYVNFLEIPNSSYAPTKKSLEVITENKELDSNITFYSHAPIHNIYTRNNITGVVNKVVDIDSVIRKHQPIFKLNKDGNIYYIPSLAFAGFLKYVGEDDTIIIKNNEIYYKDRIIPINNKGQFIIGWHGIGREYKSYPISKIFLGCHKILDEEEMNPEKFKDKIVIIGQSEAGTDVHRAAINPSLPGSTSVAAALDNLINDSIVSEKKVRKILTPLSGYKAFIMIVLSSIFIAFIGVISKNAFMCLANTLAFILLYLLTAVFLFSYPSIRIWIPIAIPVYYYIMTGLIVFAYSFQEERAKKNMITDMFGKFVSPKTLAQLMKYQDNLKLISTKKRITVMFCDVKNFTTLSEKSNPEQLVNNLNELFDIIVDVIFRNNGTIDKFIGDCIMAYWGDPIASEDDAYMAVKTALEIKKEVAKLAVKNTQEGKIVFDVKLGINTGDALLGLSGSNKLMSYTAMGDAVNVASRLESNCSKLGKDILISKSTFEEAKEKIVVMEVDTISVKGRNEQIQVYEPIGLTEDTPKNADEVQ